MRNPNGDPYMLPYVRAIPSVVAKLCKIQKKMLHFAHFNQKNSHISPCKKCANIHNCYSNRAYTFLIFFFSPLTFSLPLSLSLQLIISATDNPHRQPHKPNTTTHITATQQRQTPPLQPSTANHHHHNTNTPQNQPKLNKSTHGHTIKSIKNQTHLHTDTPTKTETERAFL